MWKLRIGAMRSMRRYVVPQKVCDLGYSQVLQRRREAPYMPGLPETAAVCGTITGTATATTTATGAQRTGTGSATTTATETQAGTASATTTATGAQGTGTATATTTATETQEKEQTKGSHVHEVWNIPGLVSLSADKAKNARRHMWRLRTGALRSMHCRVVP